MAPYSVVYEEQLYRKTEALFRSSRIFPKEFGGSEELAAE
jgi:hypothetical protein